MKSDKKRIFQYFTLFAIIPITIALFSELVQSTLSFGLRSGDLIDIMITAPFYIIIFSLIFITSTRLFKGDKVLFLLFISILLFIYGHGIHFAANSINTLITEYYSYTIEDEVYDIIYFLDEDFSHILLFIGGYTFIAIMTYISSSISTDHKIKLIYPITLGVIYSFFQVLALISANKVILTIPLLTILLIPIVIRYKNSSSPLIKVIKSDPMLAFSSMFILCFIPFLSLYWIIFDGFVDPFTILR